VSGEGHAIAQFVEPLRYKPEDRGFVPDGIIGIFLLLSFDCVLGVYTASNKNSTTDISWGKKRPMCITDNLATFMC
jgi:hypothetical protein